MLFARAPVDGSFVSDVLPSMILLGLGAGMAFNPVLLAAMSDVEPNEAGLASGVVNTSFMMGGALGLAVLASCRLPETAWKLPARLRSRRRTAYHVAFSSARSSRRRRARGVLTRRPSSPHGEGGAAAEPHRKVWRTPRPGCVS
jgi:uncharacterized protein YqjF (DUF2071 family)